LLGLALKAAPHNPQVHYALAELALATGDRAAAIESAATALGYERTRPEPFALLGRLLHLEGDSVLGARLLERALELTPGFPPKPGSQNCGSRRSARRPTRASRHSCGHRESVCA
jgi:Flp pilus assembly protein TadD